jgi:inhibitor of KinA
VGFLPSFAYLGRVDKRLQHPRHTTPRLQAPAGSVAIADNQTAVYPIATPAGWQIIGRTPLDLSPEKLENRTRFTIGDKVQFEPMALKDYKRYLS